MNSFVILQICAFIIVLNLTKRVYYKVTITTKYPNIFGTFFKALFKKINHIDNTHFFEKNYMWKKMVSSRCYFHAIMYTIVPNLQSREQKIKRCFQHYACKRYCMWTIMQYNFLENFQIFTLHAFIISMHIHMSPHSKV